MSISVCLTSPSWHFYRDAMRKFLSNVECLDYSGMSFSSGVDNVVLDGMSFKNRIDETVLSDCHELISFHSATVHFEGETAEKFALSLHEMDIGSLEITLDKRLDKETVYESEIRSLLVLGEHGYIIYGFKTVSGAEEMAAELRFFGYKSMIHIYRKSKNQKFFTFKCPSEVWT